MNSRTWTERYYENAPIEPQCPLPICGDDGTAKQCIANGHCGCDERTKAHPMFNFHSHHTFHDEKPEERADRFTPTQPGDLDTRSRPMRQGS